MTNQQIAEILRSFSTQNCQRKADKIEEDEDEFSGKLDLRHMGLWATDVNRLIREICQLDMETSRMLSSIDLSFNELLSDEGALALSNHLPRTLGEIHLIDCGIGDFGGGAILEWMNDAHGLRIVNLEQNNMSRALKEKFIEFANSNPQIMVTV